MPNAGEAMTPCDARARACVSGLGAAVRRGVPPSSAAVADDGLMAAATIAATPPRGSFGRASFQQSTSCRWESDCLTVAQALWSPIAPMRACWPESGTGARADFSEPPGLTRTSEGRRCSTTPWNSPGPRWTAPTISRPSKAAARRSQRDWWCAMRTRCANLCPRNESGVDL